MCSNIATDLMERKMAKAYYIIMGHNITRIYLFIIHLRSNIFSAHLACRNLSPDRIFPSWICGIPEWYSLVFKTKNISKIINTTILAWKCTGTHLAWKCTGKIFWPWTLSVPLFLVGTDKQDFPWDLVWQTVELWPHPSHNVVKPNKCSVHTY